MLFLRKKQTRSKKTCRFYTTGLIAITYMFRCVELAQTTSALFRRATIIDRSRNYGTTPLPTASAIRLVFCTAAIPTTRLRRLRITGLRGLRVTRLFRCRVRLRRSRSSRLRIAGLYRRSGSGRRHSRTVAGTVLGIGLVAGRDLLRLFNRHFVVGALLTSSRRDGCIPRRNGSYLPIGCLLYTSPSPRDRSLSRMPSSA